MNVFRTRNALALFALVAAVGLAGACGKDKKDVEAANSPEIVTDVNELVFVEVALNSTDTQSVTIFNVGEGDLRINAIRFQEDTIDDLGGEEFFRGSDWVNSAVLATNEEMVISVGYTPRDRSPDSGSIILETNDPEHPEGYVIPLTTPELAPRIFSPQNVIFQRVPPVDETTRDKIHQTIEVQNIGQAPLEVSNVQVNPPQGSDYHIAFATGPDTDPSTDIQTYPDVLAANESFFVRVFFNPLDDLPSTAELIFFTNDPASPEYVVALRGNSDAPCLQMSNEAEINFGEGGIGFANNKTIIIENCSPSSDLTIDAIAVCTLNGDVCDADDPIFQLKDDSLPGDLPTEPAIIEPDDTASFVLTYTPESLDVSNGELTVVSDDPAKSTLVVPVIGKGTDNACPQAVAEAKLSDSTRWQTDLNTIPLKTVNFRGINSIDQDGSISRYEWNLVSKPTGSTARFTPSATVAEPDLFLDLAGDYVVELKAFDDKGTESCGDQAIVTIRATPDEDIHVQLVWETPTDPDQTDTEGSDLDLHFLHPTGTWNTPPDDIFWSNPTSDWGGPLESDDPSLDIDDTDGAGPENINMRDPESGLTYAVGVYYYTDNGFGPSYATVRIYIRGTQQFEWRDMYLPAPQYFWYVATIEWPSTEIRAVNRVDEGFPTRP